MASHKLDALALKLFAVQCMVAALNVPEGFEVEAGLYYGDLYDEVHARRN